MSRTAEPDFQPISMLPVIAEMIEGGLADGREIYVSFQEARSQPQVLDDDTMQRAIAYHTEGLEFADIYEGQLRRWAPLPLTAEQARELARGTIERVLEQPDEDLGLGATLSPRRPGGQPW
jgi:hypothetical protein